MSVIEPIDRVEALLWSTLCAFEDLAQRQYRAHVPELLSDAKARFVERVAERAGSSAILSESSVGGPIGRLLARATAEDRAATLNIQGLMLERLGLVIYQMAAESDGMSEEGRALASEGAEACQQVLDRVPSLLKAEISGGDARLSAFERSTSAVIQDLDALGEGVDREFSEPLDINYADVMGEFAGELLEDCVGLGMERRRLVVFLTGQLMGL